MSADRAAEPGAAGSAGEPPGAARPALSFAASTLAVELIEAPPLALRGLRAVWGDAAPLLPAEGRLRLAIVSGAAGHAVLRDGAPCGRYPAEEDALPAVEGELYRALHAHHRAPCTLIHAAAVVVGGAPVLLVGESGAGKSSLALALVRRGARYLTDELAVVDGARVWGVGRSVQFDGVAPGAALAPWMTGVDVESYRFRARDGSARILPLVRVPAAERAAGPAPRGALRVVLPARAGRTELRPAEPVRALAELHGAHRGGQREGLAGLLGRPPLSLAWRDPDEAARRLLAELAG